MLTSRRLTFPPRVQHAKLIKLLEADDDAKNRTVDDDPPEVAPAAPAPAMPRASPVASVPPPAAAEASPAVLLAVRPVPVKKGGQRRPKRARKPEVAPALAMPRASPVASVPPPAAAEASPVVLPAVRPAPAKEGGQRRSKRPRKPWGPKD